jgi:hypothetical protein
VSGPGANGGARATAAFSVANPRSMARQVLHGYDGRFTALPWGQSSSTRGSRPSTRGCMRRASRCRAGHHPAFTTAGDERHNHTLSI